MGFNRRDDDHVEQVLRGERPQPPASLVDELGGRVGESAPMPQRSSRTAFGAALVVFMVGSFASFGGLGHAASTAQSTATTVKRIVAPAKKVKAVERTPASAASDQYDHETIAEITEPEQTAEEPEQIVKVSSGAAEAPAPTVATEAETLPFTGIGLGATALFGSLLLGVGAFLRRRESRQ